MPTVLRFLAAGVAVASLIACGDAGAAKRTPEELGVSVLSVLAEGHNEVADLLAETPAMADAKPALLDLRARYQQRFVALGHERESLSAADRKTLDETANYTREDAFKAAWERYQAVFHHYQRLRHEDPEFWDAYKDFNILSQYAFFELARKQEPEEAARLGIASTPGA